MLCVRTVCPALFTYQVLDAQCAAVSTCMPSASSTPLQPDRFANPLKSVMYPPGYWVATECAGTAAAKSSSAPMNFVLRAVIRFMLTNAPSGYQYNGKTRSASTRNASYTRLRKGIQYRSEEHTSELQSPCNL